MKIVKIIALAAAACGIFVSASCCYNDKAEAAPVYETPSK